MWACFMIGLCIGFVAGCLFMLVMWEIAKQRSATFDDWRSQSAP